MYSLGELLKATIDLKASDLHLTVGLPPIHRIDGRLRKYSTELLTPEAIEFFSRQILNSNQWDTYINQGELDISYMYKNIGRFRVNAYIQRGYHTLALRAVNIKIPTLDELYMPAVLKELCKKQRGLILITGPTGSGKSTTLAAMINEMNQTRLSHIITLEDPIEYLHEHNKCMINQREIGADTKTFSKALRSSLREDPDVILVGEMRDLETISTALTAAETGHLVLSTLHTIGSANTLDRIVDVFPPYQQQQIRIQLASVVEGVISQQLLVKEDGYGRIAALEIMIGTSAIRNLIREGKSHQIDSVIQTGGTSGMITMDKYLVDLYKKGIISFEEAAKYCIDKEILMRLMSA